MEENIHICYQFTKLILQKTDLYIFTKKFIEFILETWFATEVKEQLHYFKICQSSPVNPVNGFSIHTKL